jgi:hypothetical protein
MIAFINAFVLPFISLYIYDRRSKKELTFTFENLCKYSIFLTLGMVFVKIVTVVIKALFSFEIYINSSYYTAIGIFIFALLPLLCEITKNYFSVVIEVKNEKK